jgi:hypothetical protein
MIVNEVGFYKFLSNYKIRGPRSIGTIDAGTIIEIKQVSKDYKQVIGPEFFDWEYWDLPVEKVN